MKEFHITVLNTSNTPITFHAMANYDGIEWIGDLKSLSNLATSITRISDTGPITYEFRINNSAQHLYGDRTERGVMLKHMFSDRYAVAAISSFQVGNSSYVYLTLIPLHSKVYVQIMNEEEAFGGEEVVLHNTGRQVALETVNEAEEIVLLFGCDNGGIPTLLRVNLKELPNVKCEFNSLSMLFVIVFVLGGIIAMIYCYIRMTETTPDVNRANRSPFFPRH